MQDPGQSFFHFHLFVCFLFRRRLKCRFKNDMIKKVLQGQGLISRFLRACSWVTAGGLMIQVIRTVRLLVLTWLLAPEIFGIMAVVWCLLGLLREFSDTGIRHALTTTPGVAVARLLPASPKSADEPQKRFAPAVAYVSFR